ncbi:hypothetical protein [Leifsonia xyli]|nr:hypothetical protein [Leifsonia xyli]
MRRLREPDAGGCGRLHRIHSATPSSLRRRIVARTREGAPSAHRSAGNR